jgi:hypothetical protein
MTLEHLIHMPRNHARSVLRHGAAFEIRAYLRAWLRFPLALARRMADGGTGILGDRAAIERTQ